MTGREVAGPDDAAARREQMRARLARLGYPLPEPLLSKGVYASTRTDGSQLWVAGHTGRGPDGLRVTGVVGEDVSVEQAQDEARRAAVNLLAAVDGSPHLTHGMGSVEAVLHLRVYVRAAGDFGQHPAVADGASTLIAEVLGAERGVHARTAVGVASLPGGAPVELEAVLTFTA
ncbi:MAG TPA: RidA family protein [Intrasporangium sp.]|nr:RidA family protein [Intrasporangium sp.]